MIIVLMGYMGSGKSTIGLKLSKVLDYKFVDLDDYIEQKEAMSVNDIFKTKGEIYFRKKETQYLDQLLGGTTDLLLSVGGGTPCYGNNLELILNTDNVKSYYLQTSLKELSKRLYPERLKRPLISHLQSEDKFIEFLGKHLFERAGFYLRANVVINTTKKSMQEIVEDIVATLI